MLQISVLSEEATNTNFIVFGLTRSGIDPTVYHTLGEHANYYTTDAVFATLVSLNTCGRNDENNARAYA